jgi:hypothetical protein
MLVPNSSGVSMDPTDGLSRGLSLVGNPPTANQEDTDLHTVHSEDSRQTSGEHPTIIVLDIGGQKFKTTTATLREQSGLFRYQLSDESSWSPQRNGSYFVDADPVIFEHLLRFMQRPSVFPVFYDPIRGYDYALYSRLQAEAHHFQVDTLRDWIKEKKYLHAVMVKTDTPVVSALAQLAPETNTGNVVYERHVVSFVIATDDEILAVANLVYYPGPSHKEGVFMSAPGSCPQRSPGNVWRCMPQKTG